MNQEQGQINKLTPDRQDEPNDANARGEAMARGAVETYTLEATHTNAGPHAERAFYFDDGSSFELTGWAGGAAPAGMFSTVMCEHRSPEGVVTVMNYNRDYRPNPFAPQVDDDAWAARALGANDINEINFTGPRGVVVEQALDEVRNSNSSFNAAGLVSAIVGLTAQYLDSQPIVIHLLRVSSPDTGRVGLVVGPLSTEENPGSPT